MPKTISKENFLYFPKLKSKKLTNHNIWQSDEYSKKMNKIINSFNKGDENLKFVKAKGIKYDHAYVLLFNDFGIEEQTFFQGIHTEKTFTYTPFGFDKITERKIWTCFSDYISGPQYEYKVLIGSVTYRESDNEIIAIENKEGHKFKIYETDKKIDDFLTF